jgi:hypothetical protein
MDRHEPNSHGEQIHLPGPSLLPLVTAIGLTIALVGLPFSFWFVGVGVAIVLLAGLRWIRTVREEVESLPVERR